MMSRAMDVHTLTRVVTAGYRPASGAGLRAANGKQLTAIGQRLFTPINILLYFTEYKLTIDVQPPDGV